MNMKWLAVPALGLGLLLTGCNQTGAATASSGAAKASAFATSSAGQFDKNAGQAIVKACTPKTPTAQLTWLHNMARQNQVGTETRQAFGACAGIPPQKTKAFENDVLTQAEAAVKTAATSKNVTLKEAGKTYLEVTLPKLVVTYRG